MNALRISPFHASINFTMREFDMTLDWERKLLTGFGLLSLGTLLGPFGTYSVMGFWDRLTFWTLDILGAAVLMHIIVGTVFNFAPLRPVPPLGRLLIGIALGAIPTSAFIRFVFIMIVGRDSSGIDFPILWLEVCAISFTVLWTEYDLIPRIRRARGKQGPKAEPLLQRDAQTETAPAPAPVSPPETAPPPAPPPEHSATALFERLPPEAQHSALVSISMQDHYAEITTTAGAFLILIRLSDAIDLLGDTPGARVHRSHWAAAEFTQNLEKDGRRHVLHLTDGRSLPVSASYLDAAKSLIARQ